ncbi:fungal specific transcription factor domain-containing protein [Rutstroemia sp. NJR-2017a BVV2]|nr:fungal specific transcription factor domain-containing protein [Rutstroemia sp. NJR-2017a BVV2]
MFVSPAVEQKSNARCRRLLSLARGRGMKFAYQLSRLKRKPPIEPFSGEVSIPPEEPNIHLNVTKSTPPNDSINRPRGADSDGALPENGHGEWGTASLQPVSILSKEAQSGKFSLGSILCVSDVLEPSHASSSGLGYSATLSGQDDPIAFHILKFPVALGLFER